MEKSHPAVSRVMVYTLAVCVTLFTGCSYKVAPKQLPMISGYETMSLAGTSVIVMNAETRSDELAISDDRGADTGLRMNSREWTNRLVEAMAMELAKRGAQVRSHAPLKLSLALPEITLSQKGLHFHLTVKTAASSSRGWSKRYEVVAKTDIDNFESVSAMAERLSEQALSEVLKEMLGDVEFVDQLVGPSGTQAKVLSPVNSGRLP
jgi:hypothetical protein